MRATIRQLNSLATAVSVAFLVLLQGCSNFQPPDPNGPRTNVRPYPVLLLHDDTKATASAWKNLAQLNGVVSSSDPQFNPVTGTIVSLPSDATARILLPKVGDGPVQTEEQVRESLRRFINEWRELIGADPAQLSLVERTDDPSGLRTARYEQRPFRNPLRGGFGNLIIRFRSDRRVVELSSTCLPMTESLLGAVTGLSPRVSSEEAAAHVKSRPLTVVTPTGSQTVTLSPATNVDVRQLVIYALPNPQNVELRLAWEIGVENGPIKTIYLDSVSDEVIATN